MVAPVLTDELILRAMHARPRGIMTYVIRNILSLEHGLTEVTTSAVLRRLKGMERNGQVARVASSYAVQLCWALPDPSKCRLCGADLDNPSAAGAEDGVCGPCIEEIPF